MTAHLLRSLFLVVAILFVGTVLGATLYALSHSNRIYEGVSVAGTEVGGMTRSEARAAMRDKLAGYASQPILLVSGDQEFLLDPAAAGIDVGLEETIDTAFAFGRHGNLFERSGDWFDAIISGYASPVQVTYDQANLDATLSTIAPAVTRPSIDARVAFDEDGNPEIVPELPGYGFDLVSTRQRLIANLASLSSEPVQIITPLIPANVVVADLAGGFEQTQSAVGAPLVINGVDEYWAMSQEDIRKIVSVGGEDQRLIVNRDAVQAFVESIAQSTNRDTVDASISVNGNGVVTAVPSQEGIRVRVAESANLIIGALESGNSTVNLQYDTQAPRISDEKAVAAAAEGEAMLSRGVTVKWEDGSAKLTRSQLLAALTVKVRPDNEQPFEFGFDKSILTETLSSTFRSAETPVMEPILRYVGGKIVADTPGKTGELVNTGKSVDNIVAALLSGDAEAQLVIEKHEPELSEKAIGAISLDDVLAEASTYYGDSSTARRHNIEVASKLQTGWMIAPGEQFSYAHFIGSVDVPSGFVTGFGIVDDVNGGVTTAPVVGGGICQVSTTIFQAAFWSGLQIDERYSHPYWIQAYGEPPRGMKGLDAMVNIEPTGSLDLRFTNTTDNWIAIVVIADGTTVTTRILGVDPGWDVEVSQPIIYNEIEPTLETRYTESPELPLGQQLQVEYAQQGFTSEITRTITAEDGELLDTYSLVSSYGASQNTILTGAGIPEASPEA